MPRLVAGWFSPLTFLLCAGYSGARVTNQESKRQYGEPFAALICVLFALRSTLTLTLTLTLTVTLLVSLYPFLICPLTLSRCLCHVTVYEGDGGGIATLGSRAMGN